MKSAMLVFCLLSSLSSAAIAAPFVSQQKFNCAYKEQVDDNFQENRGSVQVAMNGTRLQLHFVGDDDGAASITNIQTTNQDSEYRVEGRCLGFVRMQNTTAFRIREFSVNITNADIGAKEGRIDFNVIGFTTMPNGQSDEFKKVWTVRRQDLNGYPFQPKLETQTLCGTDLTLRFNDLRGVATRNRTEDQGNRKTTEFEVNDLFITTEPCQP